MLFNQFSRYWIVTIMFFALASCGGKQPINQTVASGSRTKIASIDFKDAELKKCVLKAQALNNIQYTDELLELKCSGVASAEGIERLTQLTTLNLNGQAFGPPVSPTAVNWLRDAEITLDHLDLSRNTQLRNLVAEANSIQLPHNNTLESLQLFLKRKVIRWDFVHNQPEMPAISNNLDLSKYSQLTRLELKGYITQVILPEQSQLRSFLAPPKSTHIDNLVNLANQIKLESLDVQLEDTTTYVNLANMSNLLHLNLKSKSIQQLVLHQPSKLIDLKLNCESLEGLDITDWPNLKTLTLNTPSIAKIKLDRAESLTSFNYAEGILDGLGLGYAPNLQTLTLGQNRLTSLDLNRYASLAHIKIGTSRLQTLNIDKIPTLLSLNLGRNQLKQLIFNDTGNLTIAGLRYDADMPPIEILNNPVATLRPDQKISQLTNKEVPDVRLLDCLKIAGLKEGAAYPEDLKRLECRGEDSKSYYQAARFLETQILDEAAKHYVFNTQGLELFTHLEYVNLTTNFITYFQQSFEYAPIDTIILSDNLIQSTFHIYAKNLNLNNNPLKQVVLNSATESFQAKKRNLFYMESILQAEINAYEFNNISIDLIHDQEAWLRPRHFSDPMYFFSDEGFAHLKELKSDRVLDPSFRYPYPDE